MANWIDEITIHRFRGIQGLTLTGLGGVNILVGVNNSGKTSILEAIATYARPWDLYEWGNAAWRREIKASRRSTVEALKWLFPRFKRTDIDEKMPEIYLSGSGSFEVTSVRAHLEAVDRLLATKGRRQPEPVDQEGGVREDGVKLMVWVKQALLDVHEQQTFEIWDTENKPYPRSSRPALPVATITPVTHRIEQPAGVSELVKTKEKKEALDALRMFDAGVQDIVLINYPGMRPTIEIEHDAFETTVPLGIFGDGMRRALTFALAIPKAKNGLLLVDEIETAIHVSALQELYSWLVKICQRNAIQLFVTTHSLEAVDALLNTHTEPYEGLVTYVLSAGGQTVKRLNGELLNRLRNERGLDVR